MRRDPGNRKQPQRGLLRKFSIVNATSVICPVKLQAIKQKTEGPMQTNTTPGSPLWRTHAANRSNRVAAEATLEFGRFRVLVRQLLVVAGDGSIKMRTPDFDLSFWRATDRWHQDDLFSRAWPGIVVAETNLKVQISTLRKALGKRRIRTQFGRGYQLTAPIRSPSSGMLLGSRRDDGVWPSQGLRPHGFLGDRYTMGLSRDHAGGRFDPARNRGTASGRY